MPFWLSLSKEGVVDRSEMISKFGSCQHKKEIDEDISPIISSLNYRSRIRLETLGT